MSWVSSVHMSCSIASSLSVMSILMGRDHLGLRHDRVMVSRLHGFKGNA